MTLEDAAYHAAARAICAADEAGEDIGSTDLVATRAADAVLDLLPAHRDELLALLLGPDESIRKDGEMRTRQGVWVFLLPSIEPPPAGAIGGYLVPVPR